MKLKLYEILIESIWEEKLEKAVKHYSIIYVVVSVVMYLAIIVFKTLL